MSFVRLTRPDSSPVATNPDEVVHLAPCRRAARWWDRSAREPGSYFEISRIRMSANSSMKWSPASTRRGLPVPPPSRLLLL